MRLARACREMPTSCRMFNRAGGHRRGRRRKALCGRGARKHDSPALGSSAARFGFDVQDLTSTPPKRQNPVSVS